MPDPVLKLGIAKYAKPFMHWANQHFNVHWLTDRAPGDAFYVADKLELPRDAVAYAAYDITKTEALNPKDEFYWVDDNLLIPDEMNWLTQHGNLHRFLPVDPLQGITPEHKTQLEMLLRKHNKNG